MDFILFRRDGSITEHKGVGLIKAYEPSKGYDDEPYTLDEAIVWKVDYAIPFQDTIELNYYYTQELTDQDAAEFEYIHQQTVAMIRKLEDAYNMIYDSRKINIYIREGDLILMPNGMKHAVSDIKELTMFLNDYRMEMTLNEL